ncbi:MAG: cation-translocating P-type ATPase [Candidatus Kapabacteria bacterium]|nr:cation-translocating P-type ATPase [Candidatus Kapabacteria bacterium]
MATVTENFDIQGMSCSACEHSVQSTLQKAPGIEKVEVHYLGADATITYDPTVFSLSNVQQQLTSLGYGISEKKEFDDSPLKENFPIKNIVGCGILAVPLFTIGMIFHSMSLEIAVFSGILAFLILAIYGRNLIVFGIKKLFAGSPTMDSLVAVGAVVAYAQSCYAVVQSLLQDHFHHIETYFETSGIIIFFVLIGKHLEERGKKASSNALQSLLSTTNETVNVLRNGKNLQCLQSEIEVGDIIEIKPGDKIPVDGIIINGESYVDEQIFTGETKFPLKTQGSFVFASSMNQNGTFTLKATRRTKESYVQAIRKFVQHSLHSKASIETLTDKISRYFVPTIFVMSFGVFLFWYFNGISTQQSIEFAVNVLVIACPCALGLATPMAVMAGFSLASRKGILIREASVFEQLASIRTIVFDKTGTITKGILQIKDSFFDETNFTKEQILSSIVAIQSKSEHPIASSILDAYQEYSNPLLQPVNFEAIRGKGVVATIDNSLWHIGSVAMMKSFETIVPFSQEISSFLTKNSLRTIVLVASNGIVVAAFALDDSIREGAKEIITTLQDQQIEPILCSGDSKNVVESIANEVGIITYYGECLPIEKAQIIEQLQKASTVAYMGDGINDSIATAKSTVSIAPKNASEAIKELSSVILQNDSLQSVIEIFSISKKVRRKIIGNLSFAFGFNVLSIPIAAGVLFTQYQISLNPMIASVAMAMSSLFVVLNTLLLLQKKN